MHKSCPVNVKAAGVDDGLEEGQFEAIVSVFGNKDSYGDIVVPGAFADSLQEWQSSGNPIPVYWSHRMDDPDFNIGWVLEAKEVAEGLWVKAQLDLEQPKAAQVYRLFKGRRVTQFSFAYDIDEAAWVEKDGDSWYELRKLSLHEVGPTPIGANQETELLAVKAAAEHAQNYVAGVKAGRVISAKNETTLREAQASLENAATQIKNVLSALDEPAGGNDGKAKASEPANDEEPTGDSPEAKSEEPTRPVSADLLALQQIELAAFGE